MLNRYSYAAALLLALFTQVAQAAPACSTIAISPATTIPSATAGTSYGPQSFTASGSSATPYTYDISSGLPANSGLSLDPSTGALTGNPTQAGSFLITVTATDTNGCTGGRTYALDVAVGDQTIAFTSTAPGAATVGGATYNVTATATSGLPVSFTIDATATSVCSIAGNTVSFLTVGNCVIDADQAGNASFNAAPQIKQTFAVGKGNQTITFTSVPPNNPAIGGPTYNVTATSTSGLPVTFTIDALASSVCSIVGSTVSFTGSGNCVIDANQAGDANYNAAIQAQQTFGVAKTAQTITFTSSAPGAATVGGPTYNVTATATSGLAVTLTIDATASAVCSISGSTVSFIAAGSCVIDANQAGNATYAAAPQVPQSFVVGKGSQTITYTSTAPASATVGGATYNVTATASSGLTVALTIDATASSICSIAGNTVSFIAAGTCVIDANQAGNANYSAAPQLPQSFTVGKGNQTISFTSTAPAGATVGGATYNVTATASSGLTVALTIDATSAAVCSIAGSTVSFIGVGTCQIDANQAGNANYNAAAQALQSFLVGKGNQTITFTSVPPGSPIVGGPTYNVTATSTSGLTVTFTIDATAASVCSISGSTVSFIGSGNCVIDADQAGDANWNAAVQAKQNFGVNKTNQTISFTSTAPAGATVGGPTYTVTATATSGLTVTFTIDPLASSICSIAGSTVSFIGAGTCVIDANQAGDTTYNAAPQVPQSFTVGKGSQTISYTSTAPVGATVGGPTYTVTATATSGLAVAISIDGTSSSVCTISGNTVSFIGAGTCLIDANQAGDANWNAAPQAQQSFGVGPGSQTISFTSTPGSPVVGGPTYTVTATATSGLTVTFTIDVTATSVCSIAGSTVSFIGAGTCVIDANQAGNANYNAAPQQPQSFAVGKGSQVIVFTSIPPGSAKVGGATYSVTATGGASGNAVVFTIDASSTSGCSIAGSVVTFNAPIGTCVIDADQAGNANYNTALTAQQSFGVAIGDQTITYTSTAPAAATVGGATYDVTATATSGLTVTFSIDATATSVCSINTVTNTVSFTAVGTCLIDADQAGDANWNPAPQTPQSFLVGKGSQTISFTSSAPSAKVGGPPYTVTATATSGLPVAFTIDATTSSICSIAGSVVSFTAVGTCKIDANQGGNANYTAAPQVQQPVTVAKGDQTINFTSTAPVGAKVNDPAYTVTATGGASGNAVTFTIDATATSVCSIVGSTVSLIGAGTCVIDANQVGNANYNAAPQQQQAFPVAKTDQTISFSSSAPVGAKVAGPTYTVAATASSGLAVTITIDVSAAGVCSIAGSTVSFIGAGTCLIDANQAGNANYNAAPQAQQSFAVAKGDQTISFTSSAPVGAKVGGPTYTVTATATSGLAVTFTIDASATSVCSIAGSTVSLIGAGTCVIDANQAGNANWNAAPQAQQSFAVAKGDQTISFTSTAPVGAKNNGPTYTVTATATSGLAVTFTIDATATSVCSISGSTVSFIGAGTCVIDANQGGNANYTAAPQVQQPVTVAKGDQTITFTSTPPPGVKVSDPAYTVTATSSAGLTVTFSLDASSTGCSLAGSSVTFPAGGTCVINANQAGNANYNAAPLVQQSFVVAKLDQTITFTSTAPGGAKVGGANYTVTATASSGLAVTFSAGSTACNVVGSTVSFVHATTCTVNADQVGNGQYNAAPQVQQSFAVAKGDQTINVSTTAPAFGSATNTASPHTYTITATATSSLAVAFSTTGACSNASNVVTFGPGAGACTIDADQAGNADWNAATQVQQSTTVEIPASADNDTNTVTGNVAINVLVGSANNVLTGDTGTAIAIRSYGATTGGEQTSIGTATGTAQAGSVTLNANGSYSYDPPANFTGTDTFKYIIGNDLVATSTGTVTLTIADRIIVVASGAGGNCKPATPCLLSVADALAAPTGKDLVFLKSGAYVAPNATIALNSGQVLAGNFVSLTQAITDATITLATESVAPVIAASTTPTLTNANNVVTLGGSNLVEYFSITNSAGSAILGNAAGSGTSTIHDITVTDGANAGNGVNLTANLGTLNFSNLVVTTSSGGAFAATGGGTVNATQNNTTIVNTLSSTTGTALNVANTTIGASGLTFRSISAGTGASGPTNGIVLNNTGSSGGLTVSGTGSAASGGTIQHTTGAGVSLTSTKGVSFNNTNIHDTGNSGISGTLVTDFSLTNSAINNSGSGAAPVDDRSNVGFGFQATVDENNVSGIVTITGNTLTNAFEHGIDIQNFAGTISNATISNNTVTSSTSSASSLGSGIRLLGFGTPSAVSNITKATVSSNTITNFPGGAGITAQYGNANSSGGPAGTWGTPGSATNVILIQNNLIAGQSAANPMNTNAVLATLAGSGQAAWKIDSNGTAANPIANVGGTEIGCQVSGPAPTAATCDITNNHIQGMVNVGAQAIVFAGDYQINHGEAPHLTGTISNNTVSGQDGEGITVLATSQSAAVLSVSVLNNSVAAPNCSGCNRFGMTVNSGLSTTTTGGNPSVCVKMTGNTSAGSGVDTGIGIRRRSTFAFNVDSFPSPGTDSNAYLTAQNPLGGGVTDATAGLTAGTCTAP